MDNTLSSISIKEYVESKYDIKCQEIIKVKGSYMIKSDGKSYCLKVNEYTYEHTLFIVSAIIHLRKNNFFSVPEIIKDKEDRYFGVIDKKCVYLTKWLKARESNFSNPVELEYISEKLSELHLKSRNFNISSDMSPRIYWFRWEQNFNDRKNEISNFLERIDEKAQKNKFDKLYLKYAGKEIERAENSIKGLKENFYVKAMEKEVFKRGFCHHDFAHHNILIDKDSNINIIDFDYCILDTHLHDLCSLLIRTMKNGKWCSNIADLIITSYSKNLAIEDYEVPIMREFMRFPQSFWQIGLQVYWEMQPWGEDFFYQKLIKYLEDCDERENFIDGYF
ncbi:CotS family spore coat protein [Clostridium sp. BJN0001]|uniref:CotS family spore coat protein n=1 Tax=Clostridium sp. BJN0001 TaxID=2930219 RepID=UPI001FD26F7E|nr:CotS family spore coat protein [Clostridium sp. BJN0001]